MLLQVVPVLPLLVSMLPLWCQCYLCGVNVTTSGASVTSCGVNVTSVVSMLPLWCQCYLCDIDVHRYHIGNIDTTKVTLTPQ